MCCPLLHTSHFSLKGCASLALRQYKKYECAVPDSHLVGPWLRDSLRIPFKNVLTPLPLHLALFAPLALLDSTFTERRLSDFVVAGRGRGSKSEAWKRQRSSLFGSSANANAKGKGKGTRDYKLVQTVAVMASSRKVDVVVQDSSTERRDEQKGVLRR